MKIHSIIGCLQRTVLFGVVVAVVTKGMNYLYVDDTNEFARCMLHEFYEEEENIDRLYLGSSHVFCGIDPTVLDEINGGNNFNMAVGMQQLNTSYYLLKEADKKHHLDRVYLDLYYRLTDEGTGNIHAYQSLPYSWNVLNQMKPSVNKLSYMLHLSSPEYYYLTFLPFMRYRDVLFDLDYVSGIIKEKQTDIWKNYGYPNTASEGEDAGYHVQKGFVKHYEGLEFGGFCVESEEIPIKENPITPESLEYLQKIVEYCEGNKIELTWIVCPISDFQLVQNGQYDNYVKQIAELAERYRVPCYDFNLCRREYLDLSQKEYWFDAGHLNMYGAEVFSRFLGKFLMAQEADEDTYEGCFYNSYQEKICDSQQQIYGLEIIRSEEYGLCMPEISEAEREEYAIYRLRFITNMPEETIDVHVSARKADGTVETEDVPVIWKDNDMYVIFSSHEHGTMKVEAKLEKDAEASEWDGIRY